MKGRQILLDHMNDRQVAALVEDGKLQDLFLETDLPAPGTVYRAVADRPVKGQGGMFLKTPDGPAFLRQVKGLAPGQTLLVQVSGFAEAGKAIPVTSKLLFKSRYVIVTPDAPGLNISRSIKDDDRRDALLQIIREGLDPFEYGMILRSSCADADDEDILEDAQNMLGLAYTLSILGLLLLKTEFQHHHALQMDFLNNRTHYFLTSASITLSLFNNILCKSVVLPTNILLLVTCLASSFSSFCKSFFCF